MKKIVVVLTVLCINYMATNVSYAQESEKILTGKIEKKELQKAPFDVWYNAQYDSYTPDEALVNSLKEKLSTVSFTVFMATWCEDSQAVVPKFLKLLEACDFKEEKITLIGMDTNKATPEKFEKGLSIKKVATIIIYKNGKEINRIIEYPKVSIEQDMFDILSGKEY